MTLLAHDSKVRRSLMPTSNDGRLLSLLTVLLLAATWPFFDAFTASAIAAGLIASVALRWWFNRHPSLLPTPDGKVRRGPDLNMSAISVGGDAAGLILVCGCLAIFLLGLPSLRAFVATSIVFAATMAGILIMWRKSHEVWTRSSTSLRLRNGF
jgi:hypothetical protein